MSKKQENLDYLIQEINHAAFLEIERLRQENEELRSRTNNTKSAAKTPYKKIREKNAELAAEVRSLHQELDRKERRLQESTEALDNLENNEG